MIHSALFLAGEALVFLGELANPILYGPSIQKRHQKFTETIWFLLGTILKWRMTAGTPIYRNPHIYIYE